MFRLIVLVTACSLVVTAQEPPPSGLEVRIVSPEPDFYVSGPTLLKAEVLPKMLATRVAQLLFFADGKQVCNVLDPIAAECTWDAGDKVRPQLFTEGDASADSAMARQTKQANR